MSSLFAPVAAARPRRGATRLLEIPRSEGIEYVFGNPGTTELPLMDALLDAPDIRYVLALQEASAAVSGAGPGRHAPTCSACR
jgi:benzoylformate decarboxylase